jgi:hypothetical protein
VLESPLAGDRGLAVAAGGAVDISEQTPRLRETGVVVCGAEDLDGMLDLGYRAFAPTLTLAGAELEQQARQSGGGRELLVAGAPGG